MADAGTAGAAQRIEHVEDAALTRGDRRQSSAIGFAGVAGAGELVARGAVEQFELPRDRVGRILGFHRAGIGRIDEGQPAARIAHPYRRGQRIEQRFHGLDVAQQPVVTGGQIDEFALDAADIAQAQHGAPRHRAAFRLDRAPRAGCERHHEATAFAAKPLDRVLHALCRRGFEPAAEGEHAFRHATGNDDAGVAQNVGVVGGRRPGHQHLRRRQQQRLEPVDLGM